MEVDMELAPEYEHSAISNIQDKTTSFADIPLGTHICGFYQSLDELINMLVPFFKCGLKNNEYCMWITSEPIDNKKAKQILTEYIPDFDVYIKKEQIEIISYSRWYLKHGKFNRADVIDSWIKKIDQVTAKGFRGIRVSGNTTWLKKEDWQAFQEYECSFDKKLSLSEKMIAICTYQIGKNIHGL